MALFVQRRHWINAPQNSHRCFHRSLGIKKVWGKKFGKRVNVLKWNAAGDHDSRWAFVSSDFKEDSVYHLNRVHKNRLKFAMVWSDKTERHSTKMARNLSFDRMNVVRNVWFLQIFRSESSKKCSAKKNGIAQSREKKTLAQNALQTAININNMIFSCGKMAQSWYFCASSAHNLVPRLVHLHPFSFWG